MYMTAVATGHSHVCVLVPSTKYVLESELPDAGGFMVKICPSQMAAKKIKPTRQVCETLETLLSTPTHEECESVLTIAISATHRTTHSAAFSVNSFFAFYPSTIGKSCHFAVLAEEEKLFFLSRFTSYCDCTLGISTDWHPTFGGVSVFFWRIDATEFATEETPILFSLLFCFNWCNPNHVGTTFGAS